MADKVWKEAKPEKKPNRTQKTQWDNLHRHQIPRPLPPTPTAQTLLKHCLYLYYSTSYNKTKQRCSMPSIINMLLIS
jgi:hypothetical protein